MTVPRANVEKLVRDLFGPSNDEIAVSVMAVNIYKADPDATDRLLNLMDEVGLRFPSAGPDKIARLLKQRMDVLEGVEA